MKALIVATVSRVHGYVQENEPALIVFEKRRRLGEIIATGFEVGFAFSSAELIKNFYFLQNGRCMTAP